MAPSLYSLSLLPSTQFLDHPRIFHPQCRTLRPRRAPQSVSFTPRNSNSSSSTTDENDRKDKPTSQSDKKSKSFAVATGELFIGIASRFLKNSNSYFSGSNSGLLLFDREGQNGKNVDYEERIGAVIEDEIEPDVIWEQRVKDIEAEKERRVVTSPGFSFSAAGLLFPYHLGVAHFLIENGYIKESTPLAGSSAGAIVCAVISTGKSMKDALKATKVLTNDCRLKGTAFRLGAVLRGVLEDFLPNDIHIRSSGRIRVAVTEVLWRPRGLLVDQFDSKEDVINAVVTSSFIPGYLAPRPVTMFRNRLCIDGGLTLFMPPTSAVQTVRVCAFPASQLGMQGIGISPDCNPENRPSLRDLFNWALEPAEDHILDWLFELGYLDAAVWAEENPFDRVVQVDNPLVENSSQCSSLSNTVERFVQDDNPSIENDSQSGSLFNPVKSIFQDEDDNPLIENDSQSRSLCNPVKSILQDDDPLVENGSQISSSCNPSVENGTESSSSYNPLVENGSQNSPSTPYLHSEISDS